MRPANALQLVRLNRLMDETEGVREIVVGVIDGPVVASHPYLSESNLNFLSYESDGNCKTSESYACMHGSFVTGMLASGRDTEVPGICPGCSFLIRPIFSECELGEDCPEVTPDALAQALEEVIDQGAKIINLSLGLASSMLRKHPKLQSAYDTARQRGIILVGASGNQGIIGESPLFAHPWVIPVVSCNLKGVPLKAANIGFSTANRGLMAPGKDIAGIYSGGGTTTMTGTSVAAPFVTGAIALLWSLYPKMSGNRVREAVLGATARVRQIYPPLLNGEVALRILKSFFIQNKPLKKGWIMNNVQTIAIPAKQREYSASGISLESENSTLQLENDNIISNDEESLSGAVESYLYAVGQIVPVFPTKGLEREFKRVAGIAKSVAPDDLLLYDILSKEEYNYIAAEMRWVMKINNTETYLVTPIGNLELKDLIDTLKVTSGQTGYHVIIGTRGGMEAVKPGGDDRLTTVVCYLLYNFTFNEFVDNIISEITKKDPTTSIDKQAVGSLFEQLLNKTDNAGSTDDDRAVNYIALRYLDVYKMASEMISSDAKSPKYSLVGIVPEPARVQGMRKIVDVVFRYQERGNAKIIWINVRIDTTGMFPFLVKELGDDHPRP